MKPFSTTLHSLPHWVLVGLLSCLAGLGIFSTYIYLPSLPAITKEFGSQDFMIKLTIAVGFFGAGLGQLILGPFSDFLGRRKLVLLSLTLFIVGSLGAAFSTTIPFLIVMRFIQGASSGTCLAVVRAVARDLFSGKDFTKFMMTVVMVISVSLAVAPILGGYLQTYFGWRSTFYFLAFASMLIFLFVVLAMSETNASQPTEKLTHFQIVKGVHNNYGILIRDSYFIVNCLTLGLVFSSTICMSTMFPFIYSDFGWSIQAIGYVSGTFAVGNILGSYISRKVADWAPGRQIIMAALMINLSIVLLAGSIIVFFEMSPFILLCFVVVMLVFTMLIQSNSSALALTEHPKRAGTAASLLGGIHIGSGAIGATLAGVVPDTVSNLFLINFMVFIFCSLLFFPFVYLKSR
ncbi:Bcr/CflA family efflux MFS transporter [Candidatus Bealeia paramacronuclearis]|uniref:Bcr/CflA family efflux transporter n=1 Tax=Candidatus Bealeia paramacronuclearis TaxID=1921001 RepID=A0ABZ2C0Z4_9PROT|nr:Bcr/CflA family efflux MFS transporter [Candidatus Bealeia paramacronuclearis]